MFTKQKLRRGVWVVHYETIIERYTKRFTSEKKANDYIKKQEKPDVVKCDYNVVRINQV